MQKLASLRVDLKQTEFLCKPNKEMIMLRQQIRALRLLMASIAVLLLAAPLAAQAGCYTAQSQCQGYTTFINRDPVGYWCFSVDTVHGYDNFCLQPHQQRRIMVYGGWQYCSVHNTTVSNNGCTWGWIYTD